MNNTRVAIIGGGPAGIMAAITAAEQGNKVTVFDKNSPLKTLLYTGGGRCNLSNACWDFKELASYFPRGEKFLYSIFTRYATSETLEFFNNIGLDTYIQEDNRIFPLSNNAEDVRNKLLAKARALNIYINSDAYVSNIEKQDNNFNVTVNDKNISFDKVIIATGGRFKSNKISGFTLAKGLGHTITALKPVLSGLVTKEKWCCSIAGLTLKNITADISFNNKKLYSFCDDLLFTHKGITGPLAYKISSYCGFEDYNSNNPLQIELNFSNYSYNELDKELIDTLNKDSKKDIINIISEFVPRSLAKELLNNANIDINKKANQISKNERLLILNFLTACNLHITESTKDGEIVTAGGVSLDEIDPATMKSKLIDGLSFCGEVLNIDGLTGGFNLQACWSTGYLAGSNI